MVIVIETERLLLRTWQESDELPYLRINQDPKVIEFLPGSLTMEQVREFMSHENEQYYTKGYTLWAACLKETQELIGFIGLDYTDWPGVDFTPFVDIGWRLGTQYWGKGYATEGARAVLNFGFNTCGLDQIVAYTAHANIRSMRVMEKLGMKLDSKADFAHPSLPADHPLSRHVLYRLSKEEFEKFSLSRYIL
ncbi:MAG: GNAT family N-acetyltransferase [Sphingobacteriaceae bacterium]|nr:MAG: N-acetyltransferase [Pedobacter sp.]